ncbi:MAG: putative DNA binding domain-containing protein [Candidatus Caldarchaeum sp.]|nr:putative DNA binding domain-containing protein [Candidatus Caldarchaeum sp.]
MSDVENLKNRLQKGEDETTEFKRVLDDDSTRCICAFANHRGGFLIVGVNDDGNPVGVTKDTLNRLNSYLSAIYPRPKLTTKLIAVDGKDFLVVEVEPVSKVHRFGDDVFVRISSSVRKAAPEEIALLFAEKGAVRFDEVVLKDLGINVLDEKLVKKYIYSAVERGRLPSKAATWSLKEALNNLKIGVDENPTNAGILMFSENPTKYISNSDIRIVIQSATGSVLDDKRFTEPLWILVFSIMTYLSEKVVSVGWESKDVARTDKPAYPLEALREAVVNAVTHRNYLSEGSVVVKVLPNMITINNPGGFPLGVTPEKPKSKPRNPVLADLMYRVGLVEELGTGIVRMREACSRAGIIFRVDEWQADATTVVFSRTSNQLEAEIIQLLSLKGPLSTKELSKLLGVSRPTVVKALKNLLKTMPIEVRGQTRSRRYSLPAVA